MKNEMYKYKVYTDELKTLKRKRKFAKNPEKIEEYNERINEIISKMKETTEFLSNITSFDISNATNSEKRYNAILDEKEKYEENANAIENAYNSEIVSNEQLTKIIGKRSLKARIAIVGTALGLAIGGLGINSIFKNNKKQEPKEPSYTTEHITTEEDIYNNSEDKIEYKPEEGATVTFAGEDKTNTQEETTNNTYSAPATTTTTTTTTSTNTKGEVSYILNDKKEDKDKKKNTDKKDNNTTTEDKDNTEEQTTTEENTTTDNNTNTEEKHTSSVTEEPAPAVPDNMPIEEDPADEEYYDENGNVVSKEEAEKEKQEQTNTNNQETNESNTTETNNSTNTGEINSSTTTESTTQTPTDMSVDNDDEDVTYYDDNGNEISKEEADKQKEELLNEYKAVMSTLLEAKAAMQNEEAQTLTLK